ncbi:MAG: hypothetical protein IKY98_05065, partial [Alphaproteobacteria bacterium]|nr:hypothetical protein [Alphaproteobacteria bacterium]
ENKKANNRVFGSDREAVYAAFTQTSFYKTERDRIIKRWMPMAEAVSEGYYRYGYKCTAGHPTIGIGTCLTTSGLSLDDIPIRHIKKDKNGKYLYENGEPVPGDELTLQEKQKFKQALKNLGSSSYSAGKKLTEDRGIYGLTLADARQVATLESQKKMDEILKFAFMIKNVDMFKEPTALGVVALDIHYQCGTLTSSKEWPKFWECVCARNYSDLRNHIKVNKGANVNRHLVKETLCDYIAADYTATHSKNLKARNRAWKQRSLNYEILCGYGVDIYGLKRRSVPTPYYIQTYNAGIGMAKAAPAAPKLVKREISPERRAEFEQVRKMIKESPHHLTSDGGSVGQTPVANAPKIKTSGKTLRELQKKTRELPKNKRAKRMNRQQLTELARQNNINSENLIHLTIQGGVDINVCVDYLKKETQKVNNAVLQQKRSQGR